MKRQKSLNIYKKGRRGRGRRGGVTNGLSKKAHFWPVFAPWRRGVELAGKFFWLKLTGAVPATHPNHKIAEKPPSYG